MTNNFIQSNGNSLPTSQPSLGFWLDGGVLTFFDGVNNYAVDFDEGPQTSLFGTPLGDV